MDIQLPQKKQQVLERLSQLKAFCGAWLCLWWSMQSALLDIVLCSKLLSKLAICGPAVTHRLKAPGQLASPTAPPFAFTIACATNSTHVLGHVLVHNKSTIAIGLIHWWVPPSWHMSQRYTDNHLAQLMSSRAKQQQQQHGNSFVSVCMNWLKYAVWMDWVNWRILSSNSSTQLQYGNFSCSWCFLDQSSNVSLLSSSLFLNALCCKMSSAVAMKLHAKVD